MAVSILFWCLRRGKKLTTAQFSKIQKFKKNGLGCFWTHMRDLGAPFGAKKSYRRAASFS